MRRGGLCCPMNPLAVPFSTPFVVIGFQTARELSLSITHFIYVPRRETMDYLFRHPGFSLSVFAFRDILEMELCPSKNRCQHGGYSTSCWHRLIFTGMLCRIFPLGFFVSFVCPVDFICRTGCRQTPCGRIPAIDRFLRLLRCNGPES